MRKRSIIIVCLLISCMLVASAVVIAGKPENPGKPPKDPPPPPPEGTVFFQYNDGGGSDMYSMKADGSEKTELGIDYCIDREWITFGTPSRLKHGDHYWFLRFQPVGGSYPDGQPIRELFAVRDDGIMEVQLTNDPTLASFQYARAFVWGIDDTEITWSAKRWGADPIMPEEFGIYTAAISFDDNGDVTGLSETPYLIWDTGYGYSSEWDCYFPDVKRFDWSPDEAKLVLSKWGTFDLYIVDLQVTSESPLGTSGYRVVWSPDGGKIAFIHYNDLRTINPDGTDEQVIVAPRYKGNQERTVDGEISWSPDSGYLVYTWRIRRYGNDGFTGHNEVTRVQANGDNPTSLTDDLPNDTYPIANAWR